VRLIEAPSVEDLLAMFMTPLMEAAGFRRRKNRYEVKGPGGALVEVQVRPWAANNDMADFHIDWAPFPPVLVAYLGREKRLSWPGLHRGLFTRRVIAPEAVRNLVEMKDLWVCRFADLEEFGRVFTTALESELIPTWLAALDPEYSLRSEGVRGDSSWLGFGPWRELLLTIDTGERARLEAVLEEASVIFQPEPELLPWLRARLAARS
jgi:hypothetical protein